MTITQLVDVGLVLVGLVVAILLAVFLGFGIKGDTRHSWAAWAALKKAETS